MAAASLTTFAAVGELSPPGAVLGWAHQALLHSWSFGPRKGCTAWDGTQAIHAASQGTNYNIPCSNNGVEWNRILVTSWWDPVALESKEV